MNSTRLIFVNSRNRDGNLYPHGNAYTLYLSTPIKNISKVELVSLRIPNTMYNVTNGSNVMTIGGTSNISINQGFYSAGGIASTITAAVNNAFVIDYLSNEGKFLFSNTSNFAFKINSNELGGILGITPFINITSSLATNLYPCYLGKQILKSITLVHMNPNEYIVLDIDELKTPNHIDAQRLQRNTGTIPGSNINRAFAPIIMDVQSGAIKTYNEHTDYTISVTYPEPIPSLQRLTINWHDARGNSIDFRGLDEHAFILRAHVLEDDIRRLPPPPPLQDVEIKRIVEAMTMVPPPPPEEKRKIPWLVIFLILIIIFLGWKQWSSGQSLHTRAAGAR